MKPSRDAILSVIQSTATKREAKNYVRKYQGHIRRTALIRFRALDLDQASTLHHIGKTLARIIGLGLSPVLFVDAEIERNALGNSLTISQARASIVQKANTLISRLAQGNAGLELVRPVDAFDIDRSGSLRLRPTVQTPLILPLAFDQRTARIKLVQDLQLMEAYTQQTSDTIDKVILIDPLGGTPSHERKSRTSDPSHVLINLRQELDELTADLAHISTDNGVHLHNLRALNTMLSVLPGSASGIITTPQVAAMTSRRNPIIYNILTDRPIVSPSLPAGLKRTLLNTTIVRAGMEVRILSSKQPSAGLDLVRLDQMHEIDLIKLQHLIENSFGRKLDLDHYLRRINGRVAALVVAGDYEGAAIVTWERGVAYLDKFAVLQSSQGSAGVADIVFKVLQTRLFAQTLVWRSRANNPVNKWYFERSLGTMKVPGTHWKLFWSGSRVPDLDRYVSICQTIEPSFI